MPRSKRREKAVRARAERTQADQAAAAQAKARLRRYAMRRALGWGLVIVGVLLGAVHLVEHAGFLRVLPKAADGLYYPLAAGLGIAGAIVLSK